MFRRQEAEVLVVGAGPVGLFAALRLAERGIAIRVIDADWRTAAHSYALALHPGTLEILDRAGLADELVESGRRIDRVVFHEDGEPAAEASLAGLDRRYPFLLSAPQSALEGAMERRLESMGIHVGWNRRLDRLEAAADRVVARVERLGKQSAGYAAAATDWIVEGVSTLKAGFVVGADGHRSTVARHFRAEYERTSPPEWYAVFEFAPEVEPPDEVRVVIRDGRTSALWPLPDGRCRLSFQTDPAGEALEERAKDRVTVPVGRRIYPGLDRELLEELIAERMPWLEGGVSDLKWSLVVGFEPRLADRFGRNRVWIAGDAGHVTGPVACQSMNVGLREAEDLAERLEAVLRSGASLATLDEYGAQRRAEWRALLGVEPEVRPADDAGDFVKANAAAILPCLPASGGRLAELRRQVGLAAD